MKSTEGNSRPERDDQIGQLVRLAGRREAIPVQREERVKAAVHGIWRDEIRQRSRRRLAYWTAGLAAAALLASLSLDLWQRTLTGEPPAEVAIATMETATGTFTLTPKPAAPQLTAVAGRRLVRHTVLGTGADGRIALRLDGGPSLRLDVGTRLRLRSASSLELEQGGLYVDSRSGDESVAIHTRFGVARNVGTQFEVRLGGESLRLRVREGKVTLDRDGARHEAEAGVELTADAGGVSRQEVALHGQAWAWVLRVAPAFEVEGKTLAEFLAWVTRETGWQVRFREAAAARSASTVVLHGTWTDLGPDEAAQAVLPTCGLAARLDGGTLWVEPYSPF